MSISPQKSPEKKEQPEDMKENRFISSLYGSASPYEILYHESQKLRRNFHVKCI